MRIAPFLFCIGVAFAQLPQPIPSPFAIREEILRKGDAYDAAALMRRLKLPAKYSFELSEKYFKPEYPTAEVYPFTSQHYLLQVCFSYRRYCRIVAFEVESSGKPQESWKIRGHVDDANWYGMEFYISGNWLAVIRQVARGTGVNEYERSWFQLTNAGFEELLRNTCRGANTYTDPARSWTVSPVELPNGRAPGDLTFLYTIRFDPEDRSQPAFEQRRFVTFTRPNGSPRYRFDATRSQLTESDIKNFFSTGTTPDAAAIRAFVNRRPKPIAPPQ